MIQIDRFFLFSMVQKNLIDFLNDLFVYILRFSGNKVEGRRNLKLIFMEFTLRLVWGISLYFKWRMFIFLAWCFIFTWTFFRWDMNNILKIDFQWVLPFSLLSIYKLFGIFLKVKSITWGFAFSFYLTTIHSILSWVIPAVELGISKKL